MLYFDTSFLTPLFKLEQSSPDVEKFTVGLTPRMLAISEWTRVEFASVLAKDVRIGRMTPVQAGALETAFEVAVAQGYLVLDVARRDFDLARRLLSDHRSGLRAGDALHLAVASNNAAAGVYSLDRVMIAAGLSLGLPMNAGFAAAI